MIKPVHHLRENMAKTWGGFEVEVYNEEEKEGGNYVIFMIGIAYCEDVVLCGEVDGHDDR